VSLASVYGVGHGCRIVRVHDVAGSVKVCRIVEAILAAGVAA
jgi:dihydropteroate synthase